MTVAEVRLWRRTIGAVNWDDDHVKNLAFLMDRAGSWSLSPAFDITYSYNPAGRWTGAGIAASARTTLTLSSTRSPSRW